MNIKTYIVNRLLVNDKDKVVIKNIINTFIIKGFSLLISIFSMPLYIKYFNNETVLGIWFTLLTTLSWITTFDLGLGNGLRNNLVQALSIKDYKLSKQLISSAYAILGIFISLIGLISYFIFPLVNWNQFLNIDSAIIDPKILLKTVNILFSGILFSFWLRLINSIYFAMQKAAVNNLISFATSLISVVYVVFAKVDDIETNLIKLATIQVIAMCLPLLVATVLAFYNEQLKNSIPSFKFINIDVGRKILYLGGAFFVAQIAFMILTSTNEILITKIWAPQYVVEYQIYNRLFTVIASLFTLVLSPLWSRITQAFVEKDFLWMKKINRFLLQIAGLAVVAEFLIVPFLQIIVDIWLGENAIEINLKTAIIFAIYGSIYIYNIVLTTISNGIGYLKTQIICYSLGAILKIPIIYILNAIDNDWDSVMLANIIILSVFCIVQKLWLDHFIKEADQTKN